MEDKILITDNDRKTQSTRTSALTQAFWCYDFQLAAVLGGLQGSLLHKNGDG